MFGKLLVFALSALEVLHSMRYINLRFTIYLLYQKPTLTVDVAMMLNKVYFSIVVYYIIVAFIRIL